MSAATLTPHMPRILDFFGLGKDEKPLASELFDCAAYQAREDILERGQTSDRIFLILEGEVEILCREGDTNHGEGLYRVATYSQGSFFGELSFVDNEPVSATVRAATPHVVLASLSRTQLRSDSAYAKL